MVFVLFQFQKRIINKVVRVNRLLQRTVSTYVIIYITRSVTFNHGNVGRNSRARITKVVR